MSDQVIRIAGTPVDVDNLARFLSERLTGQPVSINKQSTDRDVSLVVLAMSTAAGSSVTLVFKFLKEYLTNKLVSPHTLDAKALFEIESGDIKITVPTNITSDRLDHLLRAVCLDDNVVVDKTEILKRYGQRIQPDGISLLQVDATICIGVLIFLTVSSISSISNPTNQDIEQQKQVRFEISIITAAVLTPFSLSGSLLLVAMFGWYADYEKRRNYIVYASKSTLIGLVYVPFFVFLVGLVIISASLIAIAASAIVMMVIVVVYVQHFVQSYKKKGG